MGLAKWAKRSCAREFLKVKISRAGGFWFGDNCPSSCEDILTKLRHQSPQLRRVCRGLASRACNWDGSPEIELQIFRTILK